MTSVSVQRRNDSGFGTDFESLSAPEIMDWAFKEFGSKIAIACSFQAESSVIIDMAHKLCGPKFRVFTLDTGRLHEETYECIDAIRKRYGIEVEVFFPDAVSVEGMVRRHGLNLFYESTELRRLCCAIRKVEPLKRALEGLAAWMTGLRREQAVTRTGIGKVEFDRDHGGIYKVNPLADWTQDQVWNYIRRHNVPYNRLHDRGYPSIGCAPCTRAVQPGEDARAGRWWWERPENRECGLHHGNGRR
ncbi:MAG TPA: phosphoadenylyl-sulfate reductase [Candidatus Acidoferrales bacterium]|nr:phosphoadenylyl-sulfate reductase [Candidatus Acidoferrales bacterium]